MENHGPIFPGRTEDIYIYIYIRSIPPRYPVPLLGEKRERVSEKESKREPALYRLHDGGGGEKKSVRGGDELTQRIR